MGDGGLVPPSGCLIHRDQPGTQTENVAVRVISGVGGKWYRDRRQRRPGSVSLVEVRGGAAVVAILIADYRRCLVRQVVGVEIIAIRLRVVIGLLVAVRGLIVRLRVPLIRLGVTVGLVIVRNLTAVVAIAVAYHRRSGPAIVPVAIADHRRLRRLVVHSATGPEEIRRGFPRVRSRIMREGPSLKRRHRTRRRDSMGRRNRVIRRIGAGQAEWRQFHRSYVLVACDWRRQYRENRA